MASENQKDTFQARLKRIDNPAAMSPSSRGVGRETATEPRSSIGRLLWLCIGGAWGYFAMSAIIFANAHYDEARALRDTNPEAFAPVANNVLFGLGSLALMLGLVFVSFTFLRRRAGLRRLVYGVPLGIAVASVANALVNGGAG